jgi:hypothetical protein
MKIVINVTAKTIKNSNYEFPLTFQEAGFDPNNDCETKEDYEDMANDWATDKYQEEVEIEVI